VTTLDFDRLTFDDVSRHFGRRRALADVSFSCDASQIVGLLGPNGAGKSTLLSMAATLVEPSRGQIRYGTHTVRTGGAALRARIGFLAHELHLYADLTVRENLTFFARLYGLANPSALVDAALERADLQARADDTVSSLSRGMRQRVGLERALLHRPRLVLLDEPFTGLDDASVRTLISRLTELRSMGCILLLTTHDLDVIQGLLDRGIILKGGRLTAIESLRGSIREQYRAHISAP
jgi:ABC-type multidrug transport system ATPase subunit